MNTSHRHFKQFLAIGIVVGLWLLIQFPDLAQLLLDSNPTIQDLRL